MRLSCFIAILGASGAWGAGLVAPETSAGVMTVVRVGANGHLVRVAQAGGAKTGTVAGLATGRSIQEMVEDAAKRYDVDPWLVHAVIHAESNFNPLAKSGKGAQGLMQLIPSTAQRFGVTDALDPRQNIEAGVRYLKYLQKRFPDDLTMALAAYNAGEGAVSRYKTVPPYRETRGYVYKVSSEYRSGLKPTVPAAAASIKQEAVNVSPVEEPVRHLEQVMDAEGRLSLRTR